MMLINSGGTGEAQEEACEASFEDWQAFDRAVKDAGIFVTGHSLADLTTATVVRVDAGGRRTITDGPFAETREVLGGYYVIDVPDLDAALDWAGRCPGATGGGSVVVRPIAEFEG
ncbi:YciI family protein [Nonomuraea sp. CA-218870]|uniref:YciI family protein n=1 Tax=Nonomuraea sp. CA-218870 TaxID=3239998 RepID=UPI003D929B12